MGPGSHSPDSRTPVLGPHVVGQRIVVRRLVPGEAGPTGGPAFTDLLGVCVAWSSEGCVVQPEAGDPVTIPLELIVSGKPVPPRPSVRHRVSPADAEAHVASLWPGLEVEPLGAWRLRAHATVRRRRATSALAMGDPGVPFAEAEARIRGFYADRALAPRAQVEVGSDEEAAFLAAGWQPVGDGDAHFQLASLARVRRRLRVTPAAVQAVPDGDRMHVSVAHASVSGALDGDWLGIHGLLVDPAYRRRGLAHLVLDALLEWGAEQGATTAWLHVETDNSPAIALYESLGFATHHTCRYLVAG